MNLTPTIDLLEITVAFLGLVGVVLHARGYVKARHNVAFVRSQPRLKDGIVYARKDQREEYWRMLKQLMFVSIAAVLMTLQPAPPGVGPWRLFVAVWVRVAFITAQVIMIYLSARSQIEIAARVRGRSTA